MNMIEWKEYKLDKITEPIKDTYNPDGSNDFIYIGLEHIEQETLRLNSVGVSSDVTSNKFKFQVNDILFGKLRPYFRKVVKPQFEGICSTDIWVFRAKKGVDQNYLFYFLANKEFVDTANSGESGSRMPRADWSHLKATNWSIPPLQEQTAIASILSSLDDKIDLLNRQNKTLEQLAETLFRQWFVEEVEESWEEICLSEIAKHSKESVNPSKNPTKLYKHFSLPAFDQGKEPIIEIGKEILSNKYKVVSDSILISKLNPRTPRIWMLFGDINENECICSTEFQIVKPKSIEWFGFIYCFLKSNQVTQELGGASSGTSGSHQRVNPQDIFNLSFYKPPLSLVQEFSKITNTYWIKIKNNQTQIRTLTQTRDTLLPKLMSGEVRVEM